MAVFEMRLPKGAGYIFGSPKETRPNGRTVVLAGQGIFLNGMLIQTDTTISRSPGTPFSG